MEPRGPLAGDIDFDIPDLEGVVLEEVLGVVDGEAPDDSPVSLYVKPVGGQWQRFFLDAGVAFWEECDGLVENPDEDAVRKVDYAAAYGLKGARVRKAFAEEAAPLDTARVVLILEDGGELVLAQIEQNDDGEGPARVVYLPPEEAVPDGGSR
ncbi:MAG: hypothetical protein AB2A00_11245 [Myxococcota bacterium]